MPSLPHPERDRARRARRALLGTCSRACSASGSCCSAPRSTAPVANLVVAQLIHLESRGSRRRHRDVRELAGRRGVRRARDLRHDAAHPLRRAHDRLRHGDVDGRRDARRRHGGQAHGAAEREDHDPPGLGRVPRAGRPTSRSRPTSTARCSGGSRRCSPHHTGQPIDRIHAGHAARPLPHGDGRPQDYGLIDEVLGPRLVRAADRAEASGAQPDPAAPSRHAVRRAGARGGAGCAPRSGGGSRTGRTCPAARSGLAM